MKQKDLESSLVTRHVLNVSQNDIQAPIFHDFTVNIKIMPIPFELFLTSHLDQSPETTQTPYPHLNTLLT